MKKTAGPRYPHDPERHGYLLSFEEAVKHNPVAVATSLAGGQSAVARKLGLTRSSISKWVRQRRVPERHAQALEKLCNGRVTRCQLCPDAAGGEIWSPEDICTGTEDE